MGLCTRSRRHLFCAARTPCGFFAAGAAGFFATRSVEDCGADFDADYADECGENGRNERGEQEVGGVGGACGRAHADDGGGQDLQTRRGDDRQHDHVGRRFGTAFVHAFYRGDRHGRGGVAQPEKIGGYVHGYVFAGFDVARGEQTRNDGSQKFFQTARQSEPFDKREKAQPKRVEREKIERQLDRAVRAVYHGIDCGGGVGEQHQSKRCRHHDQPNQCHGILYVGLRRI